MRLDGTVFFFPIYADSLHGQFLPMFQEASFGFLAAIVPTPVPAGSLQDVLILYHSAKSLIDHSFLYHRCQCTLSASILNKGTKIILKPFCWKKSEIKSNGVLLPSFSLFPLLLHSSPNRLDIIFHPWNPPFISSAAKLWGFFLEVCFTSFFQFLRHITPHAAWSFLHIHAPSNLVPLG